MLEVCPKLNNPSAVTMSKLFCVFLLLVVIASVSAGFNKQSMLTKTLRAFNRDCRNCCTDTKTKPTQVGFWIFNSFFFDRLLIAYYLLALMPKIGISPAIYRPLIALVSISSASDCYSDFQAALFRALYTAVQQSIAFCDTATGVAQRYCPALLALVSASGAKLLFFKINTKVYAAGNRWWH